ncbi:MAG: hypothetical protein D6E12_14065 [Desulfovibrio sp.]|nr:MAG: hypothetical protein D6E12_14065 [Desulfovibrio sp.]
MLEYIGLPFSGERSAIWETLACLGYGGSDVKKSLFLEFVAILAFSISVTAVLIAVDGYEWFYEFSRQHEDWDLDEVVLILPVAAAAGLFFSMRRVIDLIREVRLRNEAEQQARKAEAAVVQADRMKDEFMATMGHELRTPLNGMMGVLAFLKEEELKPEHMHMVEMAQASGRSLNTLLTDILEFTVLDQGKAAEKLGSFSPQEMLLSVHQAMLPSARTKGIVFPAPDVSALPPLLIGLEGPVRQVLLNLVGNAIKFTDQGAVEIQVQFLDSQGARAGNQAFLVLKVRDSGPGIAQGDMHKIFQPFTRLHGEGYSRQGGVGLGLSLVKRMVELVKGTISVDSEPGRGSVFQVSIPTTLGADEPGLAVQANENPESASE